MSSCKLLISISESRALINSIKFGVKSVLFDYTNFYIEHISSEITYNELFDLKEYNKLFYTIKDGEKLKDFIDSDIT